MNNFETMTVRDIAINNPVTTRVFEEFKIDYCCGGHKLLGLALAEAKADPKTVLARLDAISTVRFQSDEDSFNRMSLTDLIGHIESTHHVFTKSEIAALLPLMTKVHERHGEHHPELSDLRIAFEALCAELIPHLEKEETVLFPYVRALEGETGAQNRFGSVRNPVRVMMNEHDAAGDLLRRMRAASMEYELPEGACPSYTALFSRLADFEKDLHQHIHLENNILFPKAVKLEEEYNSKG